MTERSAEQFAHVVVRLATAEDERPHDDSPHPKPRNWDKRAAGILKSFDDSIDPERQAKLAALLKSLYDTEKSRLANVREEINPIAQAVWIEIKARDLAELANTLYNVGDPDLVHNRITRKGMSGHETRQHHVRASLCEESVSADYIRTGHCPQLLPPRDTHDSFDLSILLDDLCYRGYLAPGNYLISTY